MKYFTLIFCLTLALFISLQAGEYGTLKGRVVDEDGKPVIGSVVRIMGTPNGTYVKDSQGKYTVVKINSGIYTVKAYAVGYHDVEKEVEINRDSITVADFVIKVDESFDWDWGCWETLMIDKSQIGTMRTWSAYEIRDYGGYFWE